MKNWINTVKLYFSKNKKKKSTFKTYEIIILLASTMVISLVMGGFLGYKINAGSVKEDDMLSTTMQEFIDNYNYITENYYGDYSEKKLLDSAIQGVLTALGDPFSSYIDSSDTSFALELAGSFQGVGVELRANTDKNIYISRVFANSPAVKAGLLAGDVVIKVDDLDLIGKEPKVLSDYVRTNDGPFVIKVKRGNEEKIVAAGKATVIIPSVSHKTYTENGKKIGYIKVTIFSATTYNQFKTALTALNKENIDSLIIDLRDNSGGHLSTVRDMTSLFLNRDKIVYKTEDKDGVEKVYSTGNKNASYPIVFIGNGGSASASEVMIGSLIDNLNATLIGEKTYGKGTVQELQDLSSGSSYKFTIKKWLTPKGTWVHKVGITPKVVVTMDVKYTSDPTEANDNQLQSAIHYLSK